MIFANNKTDPNKILPMRYLWAWEYYKTGTSNNWTPEEVPLMDDIEQWKTNEISESVKRLVLWNLGFFSTAESLTGNNIVLAIYQHITNPEIRCALIRQALEEIIHTDSFVYCCDTFGFDPDNIYTMYQTIPSIKHKDDFVLNLTKSVFDKNFEIKNDKDIQNFVRDLIGFFCIMEGIFFYAGFAMMLSLKRQNILTGVGQIFEYILRDESMHLSLGIDIINTIKKEHSSIWTLNFKEEINDLFKQAVKLEEEYIFDACPNGLLGVNANQFCQYIKHIADRRLESISLEKIYNVTNPFPWMSLSTDINKKKNFFETRVIEYQAGGLKWD